MSVNWEKEPAKKVQKDIEARWTQKNGKNYYGTLGNRAVILL